MRELRAGDRVRGLLGIHLRKGFEFTVEEVGLFINGKPAFKGRVDGAPFLALGFVCEVELVSACTEEVKPCKNCGSVGGHDSWCGLKPPVVNPHNYDTHVLTAKAKIVADAAEIQSLRAQLETERQRAAKLADELGTLQSVHKENLCIGNSNADAVFEMRATVRRKDRKIQELRDQIVKLGAKPR